MMRWIYYILGICLASAVGGCQNDAGTLGLRFNIPDKTYSLVITDTASIQMSTVLLDSMPTSGWGSMLVGRYTDPKLGKVESKTYAQVDLGSAWNPTIDLVFDSIVLVMKYSGYHYGDTTQAQSYEIREVTQDFVAYNLSSFWADQLYFSGLQKNFFPAYSMYNKRALPLDEVSAPLGTFTLKPRPSSPSDSITVRLRDELGKKWFTEALKPDLGAFDYPGQFLKFFRGFCIRSTSANGANIIGFATQSLVIRLYYKGMVNEVITGMHRNFAYSSTNNIFNYNNITADRSGTLLATLSPSKKEISSKLTNNESYVQSGVGLLTKLTFAHIMDIPQQAGYRQVNSARLIIEPVVQSYDNKFLLPKSLVLLSTDNSNIPLQSLSKSSTIGVDGQLGTTSAYIYDVTTYVQSLIATGGPGVTKSSLFLSMPVTTAAQTVRQTGPAIFNAMDRICIENDPAAKFRTRLEIIYLTEN